MHQSFKPRSEWTREEVVGFHLHQLALHVDPRDGKLNLLADAIEVDPITIGRWKSQGYIPWHQVQRLKKRYGEMLIPEDDLCPADFRRS